jgi:hypothetical protein
MTEVEDNSSLSLVGTLAQKEEEGKKKATKGKIFFLCVARDSMVKPVSVLRL